MLLLFKRYVFYSFDRNNRRDMTLKLKLSKRDGKMQHFKSLKLCYFVLVAVILCHQILSPPGVHNFTGTSTFM